MQDNDPKHTSKKVESSTIKMVLIGGRRPDAYLIENLWHEMKVCKKTKHIHVHWHFNFYLYVPFQEYIRSQVKPKNINDLVQGIGHESQLSSAENTLIIFIKFCHK